MHPHPALVVAVADGGDIGQSPSPPGDDADRGRIGPHGLAAGVDAVGQRRRAIHRGQQRRLDLPCGQRSTALGLDGLGQRQIARHRMERGHRITGKKLIGEGGHIHPVRIPVFQKP